MVLRRRLDGGRTGPQSGVLRAGQDRCSPRRQATSTRARPDRHSTRRGSRTRRRGDLREEPGRERTMRMSLEVVILPVADPDRSLRFYRDQVGFSLDVDYAPTPEFRVIQLTPEGSGTSLQFGVGLTDASSGF